MSEPTITTTGNLTVPPELRFATAPVVNFTVAVTDRRKQGDVWIDGETAFYRCTAWRELAEHASESLSKGDRVIVTGRLRQRAWETDAGERRTSTEIEVDDFGPSLRWNNVSVVRPIRATAAAS